MSDDLDPQPNLVGTILAGRYRVLEKLGEGGMGAVYVAEHVRIGRRDAIKVLRESLATDVEAIARFTRGTRNVSRIQHPNVCTVYDFGETPEGIRFLAMEYVPGETLKDVLMREGALSVERAVHIAISVANALQAAHDVGVVHRDLKPANIMIARAADGGDAVKVVDFDIAKGPEGGDEVTRMGTVIGTPEYMSPEHLAGESLDGRSDIYSLGLVLFRMLTGAMPFRAESTYELMIARLTTDPLKLADVRPGVSYPDVLQRVLDRSLQRRPSDRYASASEFARELAGARAVTEVAKPRPRTHVVIPAGGEAPETRRVPQPGNWKRYAMPALMVVMALGAAGVIYSMIADGNKNGNELGNQPGNNLTHNGNTILTTTERDPDTPIVTPPPPPPPPPPPTLAEMIEKLSQSDLESLVQRQFDLVVEQKTPRAHAAARDTATAIYERRATLSPRLRAYAAVVVANVANEARDLAECRRWANRALSFEQDNRSAITLRDACQGDES